MDVSGDPAVSGETRSRSRSENAASSLSPNPGPPDNALSLLRYFHGRKEIQSQPANPKSPHYCLIADEKHLIVQRFDTYANADPAVELKVSILTIKTFLVCHIASFSSLGPLA